MRVVKPVIRDFSCSDVEDLATWKPETELDVFLPIDVTIGYGNEKGSSFYSVLVATAAALNHHRRQRKGGLLVVQEWDWEEVKSILTSWVEEVGKGPELYIQDQLQKKFHWEYGRR